MIYSILGNSTNTTKYQDQEENKKAEEKNGRITVRMASSVFSISSPPSNSSPERHFLGLEQYSDMGITDVEWTERTFAMMMIELR
jgi:hypothetical protein